jgi:hypothetical protein
MTIRLGSPDFLRMFPTVVWTLQLEEEATRAINPAILRGLAEIRTYGSWKLMVSAPACVCT